MYTHVCIYIYIFLPGRHAGHTRRHVCDLDFLFNVEINRQQNMRACNILRIPIPTLHKNTIS